MCLNNEMETVSVYTESCKHLKAVTNKLRAEIWFVFYVNIIKIMGTLIVIL